MLHQIRPINPTDDAEIELVAIRMRDTLIEVEGEAIGMSLHDLDWLRARVRWHLDPAQSTATVLLAEDARGQIIGHTIVRVETDAHAVRSGLFATTYVVRESRRHGVAHQLLAAGEQWMVHQQLVEAATWTGATNHPLINLYGRHGYSIVAKHIHEVTKTGMVKLARTMGRVVI